MQPGNSQDNNDDEHPELMTFARRRAMFTQNLADQQNLYNRQPPKRRQSTPCMVPPPESMTRPRVPSPGASIVPPPQANVEAPVITRSISPQEIAPKEEATPKTPTKEVEAPKQVETPKNEQKESIPSLSSSFKSPSSEKPSGRVIWVKPDVKPANPLDSRNLTPDQILSNDEAFKIARQRRASDSAVLHAQKMALKQSSGDIPKVFIPPPPTNTTQQPASPPQATIPPPQAAAAPPPQAAAIPPPQAAAIPPPQAAAPASKPQPKAEAPAAPPTPAPEKQPENEQKPPPSNNVSSTELPKFGSPINEEPAKQENEEGDKKPNKDEPIKPQAFKNAFKFFASLGVTPRRLSDDVGEQKEITDLQQKIDSSHRKRAYTDIH